jgi:tetratricopeptide (TPR) repeat protein
VCVVAFSIPVRVSGLLLWALSLTFPVFGQVQTSDWQKEVRSYSDAHDWESALRILDLQLARAPQDLDLWAWRARVLAWSGQLAQAEKKYLEILAVAQNDPDIWEGLASVYLREGRTTDALRALDTALRLDPTRADLHVARARVLLALGNRSEARFEFQKALNLDPSGVEARNGLHSLRGEPKHVLRIGQDNDIFNFTGSNHGEWTSLSSTWTPKWTTSVAGNFYQRGGVNAEKLLSSVTWKDSKWGAVTIGGAIGHDKAVIPKSELFFDLDHGLKISGATFVRGLEFVYSQHWYWYQSSRILALSGTTILYLPGEWTLTVGSTGARSTFTTGADWRPAGIARLGFPLAGWGEKQLSGNIFFAAGTEDFGQVDQIGRFASQTYGGGIRYQLSPRQDLASFASYQKRTQNRSDLASGLSYAIHF